MTTIPLEETNCYKCPEKTMAEIGQVHPLCEDCQNESDDWLQHQMGMLNS